MALTLISSQTAAATSSGFQREEGQSATVFATALAGTETVTISISHDGGTTFVNTGYALTATEPAAHLDGPGIFRMSKSATAGACAVMASYNGNM